EREEREREREQKRKQREREQREQERLLRQVQLQQRLDAPPGACPGGLSLNLSSLSDVSSRVSGPCPRACGVVSVPWITGYHFGISVAHYRACGDHASCSAFWAATRREVLRVHATRGRPPRREPCGWMPTAAPTLGQAFPAVRFSVFSLDTGSHTCHFHIILYL
ncbi:hypothetical protein DFH09DRAFT_1177639, partial [Mycena vulgaris]